jgi:hypothetical protein
VLVTLCPPQIDDYVKVWEGTPIFVTTARKLTAPIPQAATAPSGVLIIDNSRSHSDTPHSVGLFWTSDQPRAETSTCRKHNSHKRQTSMPPAGTWMTERPITSNYQFKQYSGVCVCERMCVGGHGGVFMHNSLRKILSFLARLCVKSSPNHSNGATT